ncbi:DNA methyltransferase [Chryseobacterium sp. A321]
MNIPTQKKNSFDTIPVSAEWTFKNVRSAENWTHGYHRYPAKFLPNIVKKIIEEHTKVGDTVADVFAGCGTTLVEAKVHGRKSVGVDINPVAQLITSVKTNPIDPVQLNQTYNKILEKFDDFISEDYINVAIHERIDYWFFPENKGKIAFLYGVILNLQEEQRIKDFFLVALSNILKNCSKWLQSSTKPQIDPDKIPTDPFIAFKRQVKSMLRKNAEFYNELANLNFLDTECNIYLEDARATGIDSGSVNAVITSPPYVTSYEYADLHQLTGYWFEYVENLLEFRKQFIGTFYSYGEVVENVSNLANETVKKISEKHLRTAKEMSNYFSDMAAVSNEMFRILKVGGKAFIVIGNTTYKNLKINSAEIFVEMLESSGFEIDEVIKRSIPHKLIPTIRDSVSGKFTTLANTNSKEVYPEEYIIIAKKSVQ